MKLHLVLITACACALALPAAEPNPKETIASAVNKLGEKPNYSWTTTTVVPESTPFKPGPSAGKANKGGIAYFNFSFGDNTTEVYLQGETNAISTPEGGWQTAQELESDNGPGRFTSFLVRNFKAPVAQAEELAESAKELKKDGDLYASDLTEDGAKKQFRWRNVTDPKGAVKFWVKEGQLQKFQYKLTGKVDFNGNEIDVDRETTVEIKDVGTTKLELPEAVKKKWAGATAAKAN